MEPSGAGELRDAVRFERRSVAQDGYGNSAGPWETVVTDRRAKLVPTRGGEQTVGQRLQGISTWDLWVYFDSDTSGVRPGDRVVDTRDETRVFNIRFCEDMTGRRKWLLMQVEKGVADG